MIGNPTGGIRALRAANAMQQPRYCRGYPCIMPMRYRAGVWTVQKQGWGLAIDPAVLISDERIEMTDWELKDFAVQIVRDDIQRVGRKLMSWTSDPRIEPSIWFNGDGGPEWVVVRAVRYPTLKATAPTNWKQIAARCVKLGKVGHFASVSVANADDAFDTSGSVPPAPLWRGHRMVARFEGLEDGVIRTG